MFLCPECAIELGVDTYPITSTGVCEKCDEITLCYDFPHGYFDNYSDDYSQ